MCESFLSKNSWNRPKSFMRNQRWCRNFLLAIDENLGRLKVFLCAEIFSLSFYYFRTKQWLIAIALNRDRNKNLWCHRDLRSDIKMRRESLRIGNCKRIWATAQSIIYIKWCDGKLARWIHNMSRWQHEFSCAPSLLPQWQVWMNIQMRARHSTAKIW